MARNRVIKSKGSDQFWRTPTIPTRRNLFSRRCVNPTTFKMGWCVPFMWEETLPTDTWRLNHQVMMRFLPLYFPIMHRIEIDVYYFYTPNRILWPETVVDKGWQSFIQGKEDLDWCYMDLGQGAQGGAIDVIADDSVLCYLGIPTSGVTAVSDPQQIDARPVACYAMIWDHYFRSDPIQDEIWQPLTEGSNLWCNDIGFALPQKAAWKPDYFNTGLPEATAGDDVLIPLLDNEGNPPTGLGMFDSVTGAVPPNADLRIVSGKVLGSSPNALGLSEDDVNADAANIRKLRLHVMMQEWLEKENRIGTRYRDMMRGRWGVDPRAGIVDEPILIGSASGVVTIQDVMQTAETINSSDAITSIVGDYSGQALALDGSPTFEYTCKEHGIIMGIIVVRPRAGYMQGISRDWFRKTYLDYPWKEFAHIGDQAIMNKELYWDYSDNNPTLHDAPFAYTPRYSEYRWKNDVVSGKMRTDFLNWHLQRNFATRPTLNSDFIACDPRETDVFYMTSGAEHEIKCQIGCNNEAWRPLPRFGIPML